MDQVHVIRHKHYNEGQSVRRIAREVGLHRTTVKKYLEETEPKRIEEETRDRPVMGEVGQRIDLLLEEWASRTTKKHRITSPRHEHRGHAFHKAPEPAISKLDSDDPFQHVVPAALTEWKVVLITCGPC